MNRIKRRPVLFAAWVASSAALLACCLTFVRGVGYFGETREVLFISGGVLVQGAASENPASGIRAFKVDMPKRDVFSRFRGFISFPQRIGEAFWMPLGSPLLILAVVVSLLFWRDVDTPPEQ